MPVIPTGVDDLELQGLAGDDTFSAAALLPFNTTLADGGDSIAGDSLSLSNSAGPVVVDYAAATVTGYGGIVSMVAIESLLTLQSAGNLTVNGTASAPP